MRRRYRLLIAAFCGIVLAFSYVASGVAFPGRIYGATSLVEHLTTFTVNSAVAPRILQFARIDTALSHAVLGDSIVLAANQTATGTAAQIVASIHEEAQAAIERLQSKTPTQIQVTWNTETGIPSFVRGDISAVGSSTASSGDLPVFGSAAQEEIAPAIGIQQPAKDLTFMGQSTDALGERHLTFQQVYEGVPVRGATVKVHVGAKHIIRAVSSGFVPGISLSTVHPNVTADEALATARQALVGSHAEGPPALEIYAPTSVVDPGSRASLVWLITLDATSPPARNLYVVDAISGNILHVQNELDTFVPSQPPLATVNASNSRASLAALTATSTSSSTQVSTSSFKYYGSLLPDPSQLRPEELSALPAVLSASVTYRISPAIVMGVIRQESNFDSSQTSSVGAVGYMQVTYPAAQDAGYQGDASQWKSDGLNPWTNVHYGTGYLRILFKRYATSTVYNDSLKNVLSAYYSGHPTQDSAWYADQVINGRDLIGGKRRGYKFFNQILIPGPNRTTSDTGHSYNLPGSLARAEGAPPTGDIDTDRAHDYAAITYDYFRATFGLDSFDNHGASLLSTVHYGQSYQNAFFDGTELVYGDDFPVKDVVAHEITHGVTAHSAALEYQWQSGALNESFSDIFAANVDRDDWLIGEDLPASLLGGRPAIRDLADPELLGQPGNTTEWVSTCSDNQGVHANSGITNKAYYNVATAIGRGEAERIFYRALTQYLQPTSSLEDARAAAMQSAADLFGPSSQEYRATMLGFNEVGLDGQWQPQPNDCTCSAQLALLSDGGSGADATRAVLSTLYGVRDQLLTKTAVGARYRRLYEQYTGRVAYLLLRNSSLRHEGANLLLRFSPGLKLLTHGEGDQALITPQMTQDVVSFLKALAAADRANHGGKLAGVIDSELDRLSLSTLGEVTFAEAWAYVNKVDGTPGLAVSATSTVGGFAPHHLAGASGYGDARDADVYPSVAYDANLQEYLVVWMSARRASSQSDGFDVYGAYLNHSGDPVGGDFRISQNNNAARSDRPVVAAGGGKFAVSWAIRGSTCAVALRVVRPGKVGPQEMLGQSGTQVHSPSIVYNSKSNTYVLAVAQGNDYLSPTTSGANTSDCGNDAASRGGLKLYELNASTDAPTIDAQTTFDSQAGVFRPDIAYNAVLDRYFVAWEERSSTDTAPFQFAVAGRILSSDLSSEGPEISIATSTSYNDGDGSATWTPRPALAATRAGFLAVWFNHQSEAHAQVWTVNARMVRSASELGEPFIVARMPFVQAHSGNAPTGTLDVANFGPAEGSLVALSTDLESIWGYFSFSLVQRISPTGRLINLDGSQMPSPEVGISVDYTNDDELGAAVVRGPAANGRIPGFIVYAKHAPGRAPKDFEIWGAIVNSPQGSPHPLPQLAFSTQPGGAVAGLPLRIQPVVTIRDPLGNVVTPFLGPVMLALASSTGTPTATLNGTTTVNSVAGVAAFSGLSIDKAGSGYVLAASSPGMISATSAVFDVSSASSSSSTIVAVGSRPIPPGGTSTVPVSVQRITASTGLGAYDLSVCYNPAVVEVSSVSGGDAPFSGSPTANIDSANGCVRFNAFLATTQGPTGNVTVARLHLTAVGNAGATSTLHVIVHTLSNANGDDITPVSTSDGTVQLAQPFEAVPDLSPGVDPRDHAAGVSLGLSRIFNTATGRTSSIRVGAFQAQVDYDPSCVDVLGVRPEGFPLAASSTDNLHGRAQLNGFDASGQNVPVQLGFAALSLVGATTQPCTVTASLPEVTDTNGNSLAATTSSETFLRGDARADGHVTIADALFIAQELVGLRSGCTTAQTSTSCVNEVDAASVHHDGRADKVTIADALFVAQQLVGLRDDKFQLAANQP